MILTLKKKKNESDSIETPVSFWKNKRNKRVSLHGIKQKKKPPQKIGREKDNLRDRTIVKLRKNGILLSTARKMKTLVNFTILLLPTL